jgi:ketosteroid isomerase-like protein
VIETATELLHAFARSNIDTLGRLCADDVVVWGTDIGEEWAGKEQLLAAFEGAFDLDVAWADDPVAQGPLVAGHAVFVLNDGATMQARVTMVFRDRLLAHAHYSLPATP